MKKCINKGEYENKRPRFHRYTYLGIGVVLFFSVVVFSSIAAAEDPTFYNVKLEQSDDLIYWNSVDGTLDIGYTLPLDPTITYYYLDIKYADTNNPIEPGFYGFNITNQPRGFFDYWDEKGVNEDSTAGTWQAFAWEIINGNSPTFYIYVDSNQDFSLIDGLQRDFAGDSTALLRINGDYPIGFYNYEGFITDVTGNYSDLIDVTIQLIDSIPTIDEQPRFTKVVLESSYNTTDRIVDGSLTAGYVDILYPSVTYHYYDIDEYFKTSLAFEPGYYGFYLDQYPSGFFAYWAARGVDGTNPSGTWQAHAWKIINGVAPTFYIHVDNQGFCSLIDGLQKDFSNDITAPLRINGDYLRGLYSYTGKITGENGIDSDSIDVFMRFIDEADANVYVDDNYDSSTPGWGVTHFNSINQAISICSPGARVNVKPGTYEELVNISKPLILRSTMGKDVTIITDDGATYSELSANNGQTIKISANNVLINDFTIERNEVTSFPVGAIGNIGSPARNLIQVNDCIIDTWHTCLNFSNAGSIAFSDNTLLAHPKNTLARITNVNGFLSWNNVLTDYTDKGMKISNSMNGVSYEDEIRHKSSPAFEILESHDILIEKATLADNYDAAVFMNNSHQVFITRSMIKNNPFGVYLDDNVTTKVYDNSFIDGGTDFYGALTMSSDLNINNASNIYYSEISTGIEAAEQEMNLLVYPGTFEEDIIINRSVGIYALEESDQTTIEPVLANTTVLIGGNQTVSNVTLSGFKIIGVDYAVRTEAYCDVSGLRILNCDLRIPDTGIYALFIDPNQYADDPPIRNGTLPFFKPISISDNTIRGGFGYRYHTIELYGVIIDDVQMFVTGNDIDEMYLNGSTGIQIEENQISSLGMSYSYDITIEQNVFANDWETRYGIYLWSLIDQPPVKNIMIKQNQINSYSSMQVNEGISGQGIVIAGAMDVDIIGNDLIANTVGIWATENYTNYNNDICYGNIYDLTIRNNKIKDGQTGVKIFSEVDDTSIENNTIFRNGHGIWIHGSDNHVIRNNSFTENYNGIRLDPGCEDNLIYNNYFSDNTIHARDEYAPEPFTNRWNVSKRSGRNIVGGIMIGGNYWDDYTGEDFDADSIGDEYIPYNNSGYILNGGDYLPLVSADTEPPVVEVLYPNGGESVNGTVDIQWMASDDADNNLSIDIYYSDDSGNSWTGISVNEPNDGSYQWDTSSLTAGSHYRVRVNATDNAGNVRSDQSNADFSIYYDVPPPTIELLSPKIGFLYFFGVTYARFLENNCFIIGHANIEAKTDSVLTIEKVEVYIDNEEDPIHTMVEPDADGIYRWKWDERVMFFHEITVIAYDDHGLMSSDTVGLTIFNLDLIP